jgi:hypothetical protein
LGHHDGAGSADGGIAVVDGTLREVAFGRLSALVHGGAASTSGVTSAVEVAARASHEVDWGAIVAQIALWAGPIGAVAAVIAVVPMFRNAVTRAWRLSLLRAGVPYSRYASHFAKVYGSYANPYLNREERLDLRSTYVPLSFRSDDDAQQVQPAAEVLSDQGQRRTVIVGSPGSGKSTLLQAHGVGVLGRRFLAARRRVRVVPFLIRLRDLATFLDPDAPRTPGGNAIVDYLVREILVSKDAFFSSDERAAQFLKVTLTTGYALVMLDGLDEVPDDKLAAVLSAIDDFMTDGTEAHPTRKARILLTCRSQNFDVLRGGWIDSSFAPYKLCALAPLGDADVIAYLNKFGYQQRFSSLRKQPPLFSTEQGPRRFFDAIREDDKIDLLRVPLILAMAVSLYAEAPELIPSTIGKLYQEMVEEMLDRHSFRVIPDDADRASGPRVRGRAAQRRHNAQSRYSLNEYQVIDKYSLLRQFALEAAKQTGGFGDFTRQSLEKFAAKRADSLNMARQPEAFVEEIISHSGLLTSAGRDDNWHYAHRSIQEFLGAQELRLDHAAVFLLDRADSLDWRQVIQFYAVGQESQQIDDFLRALATRNPELAVRCLQVCRPSVPAAREVLDHLRPNTREAVTALAAATRCPLKAVRTLAIARLKEAVLDPDGVFYDANLEFDELLPLLDSLTRTNAADIAAVLPMVIDQVPDDPRLVRPLWQCLNADGFELRKAQCGEIVRRLLTLVMEPNSFSELEHQDHHNRDFLTQLRPQAYPFKKALALDHNLITLLAWVEYLQVDPQIRNRFLEARTAGRLEQIESDRRRTISFSLFWPARILSGLELIAGFSISAAALVIDPRQFLHPFGWLTLLTVFWVAAVPIILYYLVEQLSPDYLVDSSDNADSGNILVSIVDDLNVFVALFLGAVAIPLSFAISAFPLITRSPAGYIALALCCQALWWATDMKIFAHNRHYYVYKPNEYVDIYDDPLSRHWLVPGGPGL